MERKDVYEIALDEISRHPRPPIQRRENLASKIADRIAAVLKAEADKAEAARAEQAAAFKHPAPLTVEVQKSV